MTRFLLASLVGLMPSAVLASDSAEGIHPLAPHHLPRFLPKPDGSDLLFNIVVVLVIVLVLVVGNLYMRLHALPERMAHRQNSVQLQLITVMALIALFTHNNYFWIAALLLAAVRLPDFSTPLNAISDALTGIRKDMKKEERNDA